MKLYTQTRWMLALVAGLLFVACASGGGGGGGGGNSGLPPAGKYVGTFLIEGSTPLAAGNVNFTIDAAGNLNGTTRANSSSGAPNEAGTLRGTFKTTAIPSLIAVDLTYSSPTLGQYTAKAEEPYSTAISQLTFSPTGRNSAGNLIGRFFLIAQPE